MTPRTKKQFEGIRQASIQKIVTAAMKLFATKGYLSVSVKDIALEAGISQGLMYNYFKSKEKLLSHIIDEMVREMSMLMEATELSQDPWEQLKLLIQSPFQVMRERRAYWEMLLPLLVQQEVSSKVRKQLQEMFQSAVVQMEAIFRALKVPRPRQEAYKLGAILDGVAWHYLFVFRDEYPLDEMEKKLLKDYAAIINPKEK